MHAICLTMYTSKALSCNDIVNKYASTIEEKIASLSISESISADGCAFAHTKRLHVCISCNLFKQTDGVFQIAMPR